MTGRPTRACVSLLLAALALAVPTHVARALAPLVPTLVSPTPNDFPLFKACSDAHGGALVFWQTGSPGVLQGMHVLASGEADATWPQPAVVCSVSVTRSALEVLPDGSGGAYAWWLEGQSFLLTRIGADGRVAAGWPSRGRVVCPNTSFPAPVVVPDSANGAYVGWTVWGVVGTHDVILANVLHVGPDNQPAPGWTNTPRLLAPSELDPEGSSVGSLALGRGVDGSLWATVGMFALPPAGGVRCTPGDWRMLHLRSNGKFPDGWDEFGVVMRPFLADSFPDYFLPMPALPMARIFPDVLGGVRAVLAVAESFPSWVTPHLFALNVRGEPVGTQDIVLGTRAWFELENWTYEDIAVSNELRLLDDGDGGICVGKYAIYADAGAEYDLLTYSGTGALLPAHRIHSAYRGRISAVATGGGGLYLATSAPWSAQCGLGCSSCACAGNVALEVQHSVLGVVFSEATHEPDVHRQWYGNLALVPATTGTLLLWSQFIGRPPGLYVMQLTSEPGTTGVPTAEPNAPRFTARFAPGRGVRVRGAAGAHVVLADVAGRAIASGVVPAGEADGEWTLPGTATLRAGLYFARASGARSAAAKVIVVR